MQLPPHTCHSETVGAGIGCLDVNGNRRISRFFIVSSVHRNSPRRKAFEGNKIVVQ